MLMFHLNLQKYIFNWYPPEMLKSNNKFPDGNLDEGQTAVLTA